MTARDNIYFHYDIIIIEIESIQKKIDLIDLYSSKNKFYIKYKKKQRKVLRLLNEIKNNYEKILKSVS